MPDIGITEFEQIGQGVLEELNNRLGNADRAGDLPGTLLMKIAESYLKYLERKQQIEEAKLNQEKLDPLEMIDLEGLDLDARIEILAEWIEECEKDWTNASARMAELLAMKEDDDEAEVLPEVPSLADGGSVLPAHVEVQQDPENGDAEQPPLPAG